MTLDFCIGRIVSAINFVGVRKPAYKLEVDFGANLGIRKSSAQLTFAYTKCEDLVGRLIVGVVNFPPRSIAGFKSEVLVTGFYADEKRVFLLKPLGSIEGDARLVGKRIGVMQENGISISKDEIQQTSIDEFSKFKIYLGKVTSVQDNSLELDCGIEGLVNCPLFPCKEEKLNDEDISVGSLLAIVKNENGSGNLLVTKNDDESKRSIVLFTANSNVPLGTILA